MGEMMDLVNDWARDDGAKAPESGGSADDPTLARRPPPVPADRSKPPGLAKGTRNAMRTGKYVRLTIGELPRELRTAKRIARSYRRCLEAAVVEVHGEIDTVAAHRIDEAVTAELHAAVCRWLLQHRIETMTTKDIRECSASAMKAKSQRNRAVEMLRLDRQQVDIIASLYERPALPLIDDPDETAPESTSSENTQGGDQ